MISINVGNSANDSLGDPLRTAMISCNTNFGYTDTATGFLYPVSNPNNFIRSGDIIASTTGFLTTGYLTTGSSGSFYRSNNPNNFVQSGQFISGISITGGLAIRGDLLITAGNNIVLTQNTLHDFSISSTAGGGSVPTTFTGLASTGYSTTGNRDLIALSFLSGVYQTLIVTGNAQFNTTGGLAARNLVCRIFASGAANKQAVTFNGGWTWIGTPYTTGVTLSTGKYSILSLTAFGPNETDVCSSYSFQL